MVIAELIKSYFHTEINEEKFAILIDPRIRKFKSSQITSETHHDLKKIDFETITRAISHYVYSHSILHTHASRMLKFILIVSIGLRLII